MKKSVVWTVAIVATLAIIGTAIAGGFHQLPQGMQVQIAQGPTVQSPLFLQHESNPVVYDSGRYRSGVYTGPFGVRRHVETNHDVVHSSAIDPNRGQVDPSSFQQVDRYVYDECGNCYREHGYQWTSNGVPHSDVNYTQSYHSGRFRTRTDNTHVLKESSSKDK